MDLKKVFTVFALFFILSTGLALSGQHELEFSNITPDSGDTNVNTSSASDGLINVNISATVVNHNGSIIPWVNASLVDGSQICSNRDVRSGSTVVCQMKSLEQFKRYEFVFSAANEEKLTQSKPVEFTTDYVRGFWYSLSDKGIDNPVVVDPEDDVLDDMALLSHEPTGKFFGFSLTGYGDLNSDNVGVAGFNVSKNLSSSTVSYFNGGLNNHVYSSEKMPSSYEGRAVGEIDVIKAEEGCLMAHTIGDRSGHVWGEIGLAYAEDCLEANFKFQGEVISTRYNGSKGIYGNPQMFKSEGKIYLSVINHSNPRNPVLLYEVEDYRNTSLRYICRPYEKARSGFDIQQVYDSRYHATYSNFTNRNIELASSPTSNGLCKGWKRETKLISGQVPNRDFVNAFENWTMITALDALSSGENRDLAFYRTSENSTVQGKISEPPVVDSPTIWEKIEVLVYRRSLVHVLVPEFILHHPITREIRKIFFPKISS